jgi:hypothetical protein
VFIGGERLNGLRRASSVAKLRLRIRDEEAAIEIGSGAASVPKGGERGFIDDSLKAGGLFRADGV